MKIDELEKVNRNQVLDYLKKGFIILGINNKQVKYFALSKELIRVTTNNAFYKINPEEFLTLFANDSFYLYETNGEIEINNEKDAEYYSWYHK